MGFQIKTLSENDSFFVVDIGTSRIKVLLCELENGVLKIVDSTSRRQSRKHMFSGDITDLQWVSDAIQKTIAKLETDHSHPVNEVIFSIQSSSLVTDTLSMNYVRDNENSPLEMDEIDRMVARIEHKSLEKAKPKILAQVVESDTQMKLITTTLTSIVIDGKKVSNPLGFTGKNVSLTVCNVFVPVTTFHLYSTIVRDLDKELISFVPTPIALPKAQDSSLELFDPNCCIDVGAALTTVVLENFSEILGAIQLQVWTNVFENMLGRKCPKLTRLEIEHRIQEHDSTDKELNAVRNEFLDLLAQSIQVALRHISTNFIVRNLYFSGACMSEEFQTQLAQKIIANLPGSNLIARPLIPENIGLTWEFGVAYGIARAAEEIVRQKRDPIAKILRYVIYRYE